MQHIQSQQLCCTNLRYRHGLEGHTLQLPLAKTSSICGVVKHMLIVNVGNTRRFNCTSITKTTMGTTVSVVGNEHSLPLPSSSGSWPNVSLLKGFHKKFWPQGPFYSICIGLEFLSRASSFDTPRVSDTRSTRTSDTKQRKSTEPHSQLS